MEQQKINLFGALIDGKKIYYEFFTLINSSTFRTFLSGLKKKISRRKNYIFLLDNASYHKSKIVREFIKEEFPNIVVEFFPPYCPELNPTETCWKIARAEVTNSTYFHTIDEMKESYMYMSNYLCR